MDQQHRIDFGVFTLSRIRYFYDPDIVTHWDRCVSAGLKIPREVFTQLFRDKGPEEHLELIIGTIDWARIVFRLEQWTGRALRDVALLPVYQMSFENTRRSICTSGVANEHSDVTSRRRVIRSWSMPPVVVEGAILETSVAYALLVGTSRLGTLMGLLDCGALVEDEKHMVWVGRPSNSRGSHDAL